MYRNAIELCQTSFCKNPERFDSVNMSFATGKLVDAMMNSEVFIKTDIDQSVIAVPPIGMNDSIWRYMPADNGLKCGSGAIRNTLCICFSLALQNTRNNCFTISTATSFIYDTLRTKIRLIDFYSALKKRFKFAAPSNSLSNFEVNRIDRPYRDISQLRGTCSSKTQSNLASLMQDRE
ncbi:hypothetical protein C8R34_1523 [Nitrosomonas sp. Nm84]|nr:hypothetical protein C8R34_1523 [Nitrosomonas sp. Nm84]